MSFAIRISLLGFMSFTALAVSVQAADRDDVKRSIDAGVTALKGKQNANGFWIYGGDRNPSINSIGATALAGLALLECGVPADDEAVQKTAQVVRVCSVDLTQTYSLSLSILFLDRLGDKEDVPFIKSMTAKLLAGQLRDGTWTYYCPASRARERTELTNGLRTRSDADPKKGAGDQTREIQKQITVIFSSPGLEVEKQKIIYGDNSNTQFALLALWVARRHDLAVDKSLALVDAHFRLEQNPDGGWSYHNFRGRGGMMASGSTSAMTCAGLLGLAVGNVATQTSLKTKSGKKAAKEASDNKEGKSDRPDKTRKDLGKDAAVAAGLKFLGAVLAGKARNAGGIGFAGPNGKAVGMAPEGADRHYYFLWSLERVAVAYGLDSIGNSDWFAYGADQLLKSQERDGAWSGSSDNGMVNTSFALLFLSRSNLVRDLTTALKGSVQDPAKPSVKSQTGGDASKSDKKPHSEVANQPAVPKTDEAPAEPAAEPGARSSRQAAQLGKDLVEAPAARKEELLDQFRQAKGNEYTDSLAKAIPQLEGDNKKKARQTLAERLTVMTSASLGDKLGDADSEIRRAAAIACAMKEDKTHIPRLIELLEDSESAVNRAAYAALKSLTKQDFGPSRSASPEEIVKAVTAWKTWWKENVGK
ncbi:MAG: HEAT repeat domain-containing protein [Gemmataceae bacterium]